MQLRAGVGSSTLLDDAFHAGKEAASKAIAELAGEKPALIMVFTTPAFDLTALLQGIRSITGDTLLIGATGSGEIVGGKYIGFGGGVGVLAMSAGPYRFGLASVEEVKGRLDEAGQLLARKSKEQAGPSPHAAIILLVDSLAGDLQQLVRGVYRITGPMVSISGGAAGDDLKFQKTSVFHNEAVLSGGAAALWIASDRPLPVSAQHGWEPIGVPLLVTRAEGTEIIELGGQPAALAYEEQLGFMPGQLTVEDFWNTSIVHPFGLLQPDGTSVIRVARSKTKEGTLLIQGCVPQTGSAVQVMSCSKDGLLQAVDVVARNAKINNDKAGVILIFSCAARANILGDRTCEEALRLQREAKHTPTFGFYSCGEFARTAGVLGTHNATITSLAL